MDPECKVLLVDDDQAFRDILQRQLARLEYSCEARDGGAAALEALMGDDFDVALVDLVMPGMDGLELLSAIKESGSDTVPVVLSGRGDIHGAVEAMKCGAFDYVEKMPDIEVLRSTVERAASHHRAKRQAQQMSEAATQWQATFDAVPELLAIVDQDYRFVRVNTAMAQRLGCTPQEAVGMACFECIHGIDAPPAFCPHTLTLRDNKEHTATITDERTGRHFLSSTSPLWDSQGQVIGSVLVARDVTVETEARKEREEAILLQELVNAVLAISLTDKSLDEQLSAALDTILGASFLPISPQGAIFVIDGEQDTLLLRAHRALNAALLTECARVPFGRCICGRAARQGETLFVEHVDERHDIAYPGMEPHGHYGVPITSSGQTIGLIVLYVPDGHTYSPREQHFLEAVASALAGLIKRKQAEEGLRRAHVETERILSSMSSFLIEVDTNLRVRRWNAAAENTFDIPAMTVLGKPFLESGIHWDWEQVSESLPAWLTASRAVRLPETRYVRPDGNEGILGLAVNPMVNDEGKPTGFFLSGADVTERKVLEAQLAQAQKLESIGQLAAGIAHEINTPTQYVGDNLEFLKSALEDLERLRTAHARLLESARKGVVDESVMAEAAAMAEEIDVDYLAQQVPRAITQSLEGIGRIASIVKAMKEFSHPGTEEKTCVNLNDCIASTITVSRNEWKYVADLQTNFDAGLPPVPCLPGEFNQVILNILVNAAHAITEAAGESSDQKGAITVTTRKDDDWAEVRITDTGAGIPDAVRDRIFDPFFTTKGVGRGTGQGLTIARNVIVDKHGGTLDCQTKAGKGTTFIIRLPLSEE
jgi:PAS domain S-box-containing protein